MNQPSRNMPPYIAPPMTTFALVSVVVLFIALIYLLSQSLWCLVIVVCLCILISFDTRKRNEKLTILIHERKGESICEFARSFETKEVDTWVIRAVFEALQAETEVNGKSVPIRVDDSLAGDLQIDEDDLDLSVVEVIAQRCGRSLAQLDENPLIGNVKTAGDLVMFFNFQPAVSKEHCIRV